jgi:hypothetical protein
MRDDKDFLSYKTYVYNFFNSSNFFNFTQVEPAKLELFINQPIHFAAAEEEAAEAIVVEVRF